jgi:DNA modification methylase
VSLKPYYDRDGITIYHGNCADILPQLEPVDLVLTDPPYGIGFAAQPTKWQRRDGFQPQDWDNAPPPDEVMAAVVAAGRNACVWGGNYFTLPLSRGWLVWVKPDAPPSMGSVELCWTNKSMTTSHIIQPVSGVRNEQHGRLHPTQKPLRVIQWCLTFFPDAGTVLDPFVGSGTTLRAAKNLGLRAIGIEIDERYCDMAARCMAQEVLPLGGGV